ncbi:MAG: acyl-CoA thioesterase [Opitutales bacterium]|nr:acyl-CoA thioesterase [Opitutales bacterium]MCH8539342.1 acyl-CoA thioesterase [Opitutales bacterium]
MKDFSPISRVVVHHRVQFSETDMAGLVHFSQFFRYMEKAEAEFFRQVGVSMVQQDGSVFRGWPRGRVSAKFMAPLYFEDVVEIELLVKEIKERALTFFYRFRRRESPFLSAEGRPVEENLAKGEMTTVLVEKSGLAGSMQSLPLPQSLRDRIREADPIAMRP